MRVDIVVELVEVGDRRKTRPRNVSNSREVKTVYDQGKDVGKACKAYEAQNSRESQRVD